jgi:hypothetical protein
MPNRREFLKTATGAAAGAFFQIGAKPGKRRELSIAGKRVKTIDAHAHCFVPEVWDLVKNTPLAAAAKNNITGNIALGNPQRLIDMDAQGIDYQAINVNAWGYSADRALAKDLIKLQNEKISEYCAKHSDRFVGMATLALQHPDLAADQLEEAVKKLTRHNAKSAIAGKRGLRQHDRQSAGNDRLSVPPDFRRHARSISPAEDMRGTRRRLSRILQWPLGCSMRKGRRGGLQGTQEKTRRVLPGAALRR